MTEQAKQIIRPAMLEDGPKIFDLVRQSEVLDRNSCYLYLLLCRDFQQTCVVAENADKVVGFASGYRRPQHDDTLFIWQIAVSKSARRSGLGRHMLLDLVARNCSSGIHYLEATISASNQASQRLFESVADQLDAPLQSTSGFTAADFGFTGHEAEPGIRIGPFGME